MDAKIDRMHLSETDALVSGMHARRIDREYKWLKEGRAKKYEEYGKEQAKIPD